MVAAFVEGCLAGGALPTAKHFPGHGNTEVDSHHALPTVAATRAELDQRDLPPFRAAIAAGAPAIMTAHVGYPALDPTGVPATLSHAILTRLLRDELGFEGAVVSDSFLMEGVKAGSADEGERAARAVAAGVDMLVDLADPLGTLDALVAAASAGRLSEDRVDEALSRVGRLKSLVFGPADERLAAFSRTSPDGDTLRDQTAALAEDVARRATVVLKDAGRLPLDPSRSLCAVLINQFPRAANSPAPLLGELLAAKVPRLTYFELGAAPSPAELDAAAAAAEKADEFLAAFIVKPAAWHQFGLPPWAGPWLTRLAGRRPTIAACLGARQGLAALPAAAAALCTFSDVPASQAALVEKLLRP
jgi:beta-glucosidase-like glycosyl hydrolase